MADTAMMIESMFVLNAAADGWASQQWNATTDEVQMAIIGEWEEAIATKATEVSESRKAAGLMEGPAEESEEEATEESDAEAE